MRVLGIHHISNIVSHPQENIDFYASFLGLRLIKKAVNFDDAGTYHFYYGNHNADLGTVITSFPIGRDTKDGIIGGGQTTSTYYIIPNKSFDFWKNRIESFGLRTSIEMKFNKKHLIFSNYLGIKNELVESDTGITNLYEYNGITKNEAIKGFFGAEITSTNYLETIKFFKDILNAKEVETDNNLVRLEFSNEIGKYVDIVRDNKKRGRLSKGTVHHIALSVKDLESLESIKKEVEDLGIRVTDIKERDFFKAIYFREPGGTIIELSTIKPGFNNIDDRAKDLYLPKHLEHKRDELNETLVPVFVNPVNSLERFKYFTKEEFKMYLTHKVMLNRINELAKISKERELTDEELIERAYLREEYVKNIGKSFTNLADNVRVVEDGKVKSGKENL